MLKFISASRRSLVCVCGGGGGGCVRVCVGGGGEVKKTGMVLDKVG